MDTTGILLGILFSSIGVGYALYGRKQQAPVALIAGLILMVYPYFIDSHLWLVMIGVVLMALPRVIRL